VRPVGLCSRALTTAPVQRYLIDRITH